MIRDTEITEKQITIPWEEIEAVAHQIARKFKPRKIVLFGSYARGDCHPHSDIDLLVLLEKKPANVDIEIEIALSVPHKFPMDILVRSQDELADRLQMGDTFLQDIVEQGVILYECPGQ